MIQIKLTTSSSSVTKVVEIDSTPKQLFDDLGMSIQGTRITLNGYTLGVADLNTPFSDLGVEDNTKAFVTSVVKADGAAIR